MHFHSDDPEFDKELLKHAPPERNDPKRPNVSPTIRRSIKNRSALEAIVLTADIRRSASILKESIDIPQYAKLLDDFVADFRTSLFHYGGWFDKFTGDGFIGYWIVENSFSDQMDAALDFSCSVMDNFRSYYYQAFLANMRNVPSGIGLSIGMDAGPCYLMPIAGELTIIGSPIVGSVRMCANSEAYNLVLNAYSGSRLLDGMTAPSSNLSDDLSYQVKPRTVKTKEYPDGQIAYAVEFFRKGRRLFV